MFWVEDACITFDEFYVNLKPLTTEVQDFVILAYSN
jgi:hypothetical protein